MMGDAGWCELAQAMAEGTIGESQKLQQVGVAISHVQTSSRVKAQAAE
jgi:hypothetical protein